MTHPFHPLFGREFTLISRERAVGGDRVHVEDDRGEVRGLPAAWTSEATVDPVVVVGEGRARFRADDLLELARRIGEVLR